MQEEHAKPDVNIVLHWLGRLIFAVMGWRLKGTPVLVKKAIIIGGPHTALTDGFILVVASWVGRRRLRWLVKEEMTRGPVGWLVRATGGIGIQRGVKKNTVQQVAEIFDDYEQLLIVLSPAGTRKKTDHWKSGFYWMAVTAEVPLFPVGMNYGTKEVDLSYLPFMPSGDIEADVAILREYFQTITARHPEKVSDMRVMPPQTRP